MQNNFSSAIEDRNAKKIKSELTFVGIKSSAIENFEKTAEALYFTVKFVSEIISVKNVGDFIENQGLIISNYYFSFKQISLSFFTTVNYIIILKIIYFRLS